MSVLRFVLLTRRNARITDRKILPFDRIKSRIYEVHDNSICDLFHLSTRLENFYLHSIIILEIFSFNFYCKRKIKDFFRDEHTHLSGEYVIIE